MQASSRTRSSAQGLRIFCLALCRGIPYAMERSLFRTPPKGHPIAVIFAENLIDILYSSRANALLRVTAPVTSVAAQSNLAFNPQGGERLKLSWNRQGSA
jgi:hypothetical protein